jgi:hypothetical protein
VCTAAGFFSVFVLEEGKKEERRGRQKASERKTRYVCCVELSKIIDRSRKPSENSLEKLFSDVLNPATVGVVSALVLEPSPQKEQRRIQAGTCPLSL